MATCFLARGWFVLSLHVESERICCSLEYWVLYYTIQSVVEFSYHGIYYCFRFQQMLECISDSGLTQHTITNCLLHLHSDKAFAGFQHVCSINVADVSKIYS
jgi:hypothetical protein